MLVVRNALVERFMIAEIMPESPYEPYRQVAQHYRNSHSQPETHIIALLERSGRKLCEIHSCAAGVEIPELAEIEQLIERHDDTASASDSAGASGDVGHEVSEPVCNSAEQLCYKIPANQLMLSRYRHKLTVRHKRCSSGELIQH